MTLTPSRMRFTLAMGTLVLTAASSKLGVDSGVMIACITFSGSYIAASKGGETLQAIKAKLPVPAP